MRAFRVVIVLLAFGSTFAWADQLYQVSIFSDFTATQPCVTNCNEIVAASFQWVETNNILNSYVVPGTFWASASGFLGPLLQADGSAKDGYFIPVDDLYGDELDINFSPTNPFMDLWSCGSQACINAYDPLPSFHVGGFLMPQTFGWSEVSTVPEPSSLALLIVPAIGFLGWKRKNVQSIP